MKIIYSYRTNILYDLFRVNFKFISLRNTCYWLFFSFNIIFLNQKNSIIIDIQKINKTIYKYHSNFKLSTNFFTFPTKEISFNKIQEKIK